MLVTVDWIAIALGCTCGVGILVCWRSTQKWRRRYQELERSFQHARDDADERRLQLQRLIDCPPVPSDAQFVSHLSALCAKIVDQVLDLEGARLSSVEPLRFTIEESEQSRVVDRKKRFAKYFDTLRNANIDINQHIERLLKSHTAILTLRDAMMAGHLNSLVGHSDCMAIVAIIEALNREESPDDAWRKAIQKVKKEFDPVLKLRDARNDSDKREREAALIMAAGAFNKYKLPPMTPLEKFRALAPQGQRDNFD